MKFVVIPDSFKGSLSSVKICQIIKERIEIHFPEAQVESIPVADGGEGTVECFLKACNGHLICVETNDPYFNKIQSFYGLIEGDRAVIEMAASAGLPLVGNSPDPFRASTFGVGELLLNAINHGCKNIILGLGGSATNDGGCGLACALGAVFYDENGVSFIPAGGTLKNIDTIDISKVTDVLKGISLSVMCDIENPLFGSNGAAFVYAPQKGADSAMVQQLDDGLKHLSMKINECLDIDVSNVKGGGAAGGLGAGMIAFCGASLAMGIETVLDEVDFDKKILDADLVITGEGRIDMQSLSGKVLDGISHRTQQVGIPLIAIVGDIGDGIESIYDRGVQAVFSINSLAIPFSEAKKRSAKDLEITVDNLLRYAKIWNNK